MKKLLTLSFAFSLSLFTLNAQVKKIYTVAGNGYIDYSGDSGSATAAQLYAPYSVAKDTKGNIYIADQSNNVVRKISASGVVSTFAGTGKPGYTRDTYPATTAELNQPTGIVTDALGNVYVSDMGNNRVRKISTTGIITTFAGDSNAGYSGNGGPATAAELYKPMGLAIDNSGNIYIADKLNNRIRMVSAGVITTIAGKGAAGDSGDGKLAVKALLNNPTGVAVDTLGNVYIADMGNNRIRKIDLSGTINTIAGNGKKGYSGDGGSAVYAELYNPVGVGVDLSGDVYIADGDNRVRMIKKGIISTITGNGSPGYSGDGGPDTLAQINTPTSVITDDSGNIYITDNQNYVIRKIDTTGMISTIIGDGTGGYSGNNGPDNKASVRYPDGVAVDAADNIYVADRMNNVVRKISASGIITTIAGTGVAGYSGDGGPATAAGLNNPVGVAVDPTGNIYITDVGNNCIRKVDALTGTITTIAGNGTAGYSGDGGPATAAMLNTPYGITSDASGNIYFTDMYNYRVREINAIGNISTVAGNGIQGYSSGKGIATKLELSRPLGVATDKSGNVYISDVYQGLVWKVTTKDTMSILAGDLYNGYSGDSGAATNAMLYNPIGVAVDNAGNVYISDQTNNRIRMVNTKGIIFTAAGTGMGGYSGDTGPATYAMINAPAGIATDASGNVFFSDHDNHRIRELTGNSALAVNIITQQNTDVKVYPNPSSGMFTVQLPVTGDQRSDMEIYNITGKNIYSSGFVIRTSEFVIDISSQPAGIYIYRLTSQDGSLLKCGKLVIER